ncbi:asparaginase [Corynebacterium sp. zg254]|uniref:asparaginase n=1 Tax=Corynebacterium zhongnanshanii TaxID=2768834 RepID=A0ABQ6VDC0_9CORY|nr:MULTISPECIES: asparaginase domain-containing protein [Corynebacterium]KAB3520806.1 asparaginase [Corynebacterium zhongnanshanii]MCR5914424.1 asparaginase [Corynebacterium sp. zg254]
MHSPSLSTGEHPAPDRGPVIVLGTGGTISCTHGPSGDLVPTLSTADLVARAGIPAEARDILHLDSSNLTLEDIDALLHAINSAIEDGAGGIILLHGTDTMEETAMAVDFFFAGTVPIVLTGAQRPADDSQPDGPDNIRRAYQALGRSAHSGEHSPADSGSESPARPAASSLAPASVSIAFGPDVLPAYGATKRHTTDDRAFSNASASASHSATPSTRPLPRPQRAPLKGLNVPIVTMFAGATADLVPQNIDGLVVEALGSGNVPAAVAERLSELTCPVIICTRVPEGEVHFVYGGPGGGASLQRAGVRSGGFLRPSQARIELLCELATSRDCPQG